MPDRFELPTTPEQWVAIEPNDTDIRCAERHMREMNDGHEPYVPAVYGWARGMAAARLLERERCVERLAEWFGTQGGFDDDMSAARDRAEARRILEDAK